MDKVCDGVYRVSPLRITPTKYASFFVEHPSGNLMLPCYSRGGLTNATLDAITTAGGLLAQLLCDMHVKDALCDDLQGRFGAWTYCSEPEADDVRRTVQKLKTFPFRRHSLFPHVEVIPTPGHRPGGTCFLVDMGKRRVLFAGDNVGYDGHHWTAYPSRQGHKDMLRSLDVLAECEFDVLCATTLVSEPVFSKTLTTPKARKAFFASIAATLS